jgi:hypothetical protein
MYCMRCNKNIINCTCPDIEERLKSLGNNPILSIAIESNLIERKMKVTQNKQEVDLISDFNMEYGNEDNWTSEVKADFDIRWKAIQRQDTLCACKEVKDLK